MSGSVSSVGSAFPTPPSLGSRRGRPSTFAAAGSFRPRTSTSRSPSSATGREASWRRSSMLFGAPHRVPMRSSSRPTATARAGASGCSCSATSRERRPASPTTFRVVSRRSASTGARREHGFRTSRSCASASARGCGRPSRPSAASGRPRRLLSYPGCVRVGRSTSFSNRSVRPSEAAAFLSRLRPGGAEYVVLESVRLGGT